MAAVATIRPNTKAMKIAYKILKTPKELQQSPRSKPANDNQKKRWFRDSMYSR